jgi:DNA-binding NarL/FixJ family response regulator
MKRRINIGIAEDHDLVRKGYVGLLKNNSDIKIIFEAANGKELMEALKVHQPDIILLDISMPLVSGTDAMTIMKQYFPNIKIIVISAYSDDFAILEYIKLGADSFLPKYFKTESLVSAIYSVYKHGSYFEENITKLLAKSGTPQRDYLTEKELTEREKIILKYICENKPYKDIAAIMKLSERTIDWYKHKLIHKTNSENMDGLLVYAKKNGIV